VVNKKQIRRFNMFINNIYKKFNYIISEPNFVTVEVYRTTGGRTLGESLAEPTTSKIINLAYVATIEVEDNYLRVSFVEGSSERIMLVKK